jgi:Bifunctional DNA primase/polymerase, N-terminal
MSQRREDFKAGRCSNTGVASWPELQPLPNFTRITVPSIPLGANKRPAVRGFKIASLTVDQSRRFMRLRPEADALGVPDGPLSGLVRIDIDEPGDDVVGKVIRRTGDTPAKIRTASDKMHLVFADNGERRLTGAPGEANARPWDDIKADLCGAGGYSISPPSMCNGGTYELLGDIMLEQLLKNRHRLPKIRGLPPRAYPPTAPVADTDTDIVKTPLSRVPFGERDANFYPVVARICQRIPQSGGTKENAMDEACACNTELPVPLEDCEVIAKVNYWWAKTLSGENQYGTGQGPATHHKWMQALAGDPPLYTLLGWLKEENRPNSEGFLVADGLVKLLGGWWSKKKISEYRRRLIADGWIVSIRQPRRGVAALYRWGPTARQKLFS